MKSTSTVSDKGLTTIPKDIRKKLKIRKGDKIHWFISEENKSDLIIIHDPLKYLDGKHSQESITYEKLEHQADKMLFDQVKKKSQ